MPRRIVSLVPSLTHTVCDWGLQNELVGCTTFCIKPAGLHRTAKIVGGTKDPDISAITDLKPTHIIMNDEENNKEHYEALKNIAQIHINKSRIVNNLSQELIQLGNFLGVENLASKTASRIDVVYDSISKLNNSRPKSTFLYFIWREPYMVVSKDTYIDSMMSLAGYENLCTSNERYPQITIEEINNLNPQFIFLSTEPYPFRKRDYDRLERELAIKPQVLKADGMQLSWYGSMALECLENIKALADEDKCFDKKSVFQKFS